MLHIMLLRSLLPCAVLLLPLALALPSRAQLAPGLVGVKRIVCLGDSITQSGERPGGYVWLIRHNLNLLYPEQHIEVRNAGVSGNKSTDMIARFQHDVLDRKPDLITISVGVNDVWHGFYDHPKGDGPLGIPLEAYIQNVDQMCERATKANARVILLTATLIEEDVNSPENKKAWAYTKALADLANRRRITFVNMQRAFREVIGAYRRATRSTRNFLTVDGVHMNGQGNQLMSDCILNALGVPETDRAKIAGKVLDEIYAKQSAAVIPPGSIVSVGKTATASSATDGYPASNATAAYTTGSTVRWCAREGTFNPPQWWMVDLGKSYDLTGLRILFAPDDLDTWKYRVEVSEDGTSFQTSFDETNADDFVTEKTHLFAKPTTGRYVRIVFTDQTSAMNWASLRNVMIFAQ